ncbi:MAG: hypothetical protein ABSH17_10495 [Syntrophobacteraceae bacterium]|jgi:hypothetical protein
MAKVFDFPHQDEWASAEKLIAKKMKQEGFGEEAIKTVNERVRAYREKYLATRFDWDLVGLELSPEAMQAIAAAVQKVWEQVHQLTNDILEERISTEIALLDFDRD